MDGSPTSKPSRLHRTIVSCARVNIIAYFKVLAIVVATVFFIALVRCLYYVITEGLAATVKSGYTWLWFAQWVAPWLGRYQSDSSGIVSIVPMAAGTQSAYAPPSPESTSDYWSFAQAQFIRVFADWNKYQFLWKGGPFGVGALVAWGLYAAQASSAAN